MRTRWLYTAMLVAVFVCVPVVAGGFERPAAAASLIGIVLARRPVVQVLEGARGAALIPVLGATGRIQLVSGALLALGIAVSRSEEHTSELQSLMRISYAVFCLKKKKSHKTHSPRK